MTTVSRYFRNGAILFFCLFFFLFVRHLGTGLHLTQDDTWSTTGRRQTWWQGATRVRNSQADSVRTETSTSLGNSRKCRKQWRKGNDTEWFSKNFDPSLKPIWTKENINIPSEVFDWWNNLFYNKSQPYVKVISLVKHLALNSDPFFGNRLHDCVTCAVVGNSGNLRKSGYGNTIDDHDIIIRMNESPTVGYEEDVGNRTTHYIAYPQSFKEASLRNVSFVLAAFCYSDMEWLSRKLILQSERPIQTGSTVPFDKNRIFVLNPELMWQIKHKWGLGKGKYSSTGILGVFFALQICDEVDVYGFGATSKGNWDHYFSEDDGEKNSLFKKSYVHDSEAEELLLQKLIEVKKITVYKGLR